MRDVRWRIHVQCTWVMLQKLSLKFYVHRTQLCLSSVVAISHLYSCRLQRRTWRFSSPRTYVDDVSNTRRWHSDSATHVALYTATSLLIHRRHKLETIKLNQTKLKIWGRGKAKIKVLDIRQITSTRDNCIFLRATAVPAGTAESAY